MPVRHPLVPVSHVLEEPITITNYNNKVDEIISRGLAKELLINELSKLPPDILLSDKKNVYYCKLAMDKKEEVNRNKNLVPVEKILSSLKNVTKKSNSRYVEKVAFNKRNGIKPWEHK